MLFVSGSTLAKQGWTVTLIEAGLLLAFLVFVVWKYRNRKKKDVFDILIDEKKKKENQP